MEGLLIFIVFIVFSAIRSVADKARRAQSQQEQNRTAPGWPAAPPVLPREAASPVRPVFPQPAEGDVSPVYYDYPLDINYNSPLPSRAPETPAAFPSLARRYAPDQAGEKAEAPIFQLTKNQLVQAVISYEVLGPPRSRKPRRHGKF